mmetsp:Transcript_11994/g.26099  ORF Transcript_11994/g.26099 Transcript_11994/m.26099 type:complete len:1429 (-) Transcript_11994:47-4333(-)
MLPSSPGDGNITDIGVSAGITLPPGFNTRRDMADASVADTLSSVQDALSAFGVISSKDDNAACPEQIWHRPIPSNLFRPPSHAPSLTTMMPRSRLPPGAKIRETSSKDDTKEDDEDELVEVWVYSLASEHDDNVRGNDLTQRPLQGNLSSKLVEYTRGTMGVRRPFRPGGLDDEDAGEAYESEYLTKEAIDNARLALTIGSKEALERGILLTAPPGMSFSEGLRYQDVFSDAEEICIIEKEMDEFENDPEDEFEMNWTPQQGSSGDIVSRRSVPEETYDRSYFDEDSLFGESSSSSDESTDEDDDDEIEDAGELPVNISQHQIAVTKVHFQQPAAVDEVDTLLSELDMSLQTTSKTLPTKTGTPIHPSLPKKDPKNDKSRKSWAVTDYIPLTSTNDFHTMLPNPALTFPFELDDFQKQAVLRLERSECVFLAAHTSAGKTVSAEYAIALAMKHCTRAIYTSPIKALSNQKYRDFKSKFGDDVGLITGDMQIGADGSCLIMTTEILRSMLYRGADLIRDIEWVIFDEVHYINDSERGVVWEEVIIMLPEYVNLIFLSATTPNTIEFSEWIGRTKRKPVHVIRTNYRPVPLSHNLWAGGKLHKILEGKGAFDTKGYTAAAHALLPASAREAAEMGKKGEKKKTTASGKTIPASKPSSGSRHSSWQQQGSKQDWIALVRFLEREGLMPTVTFSFSKRKCEELADSLRSLDLNTQQEKNAVQSFAIQTVNRLSPQDKILPQVIKTVEMVKRGIAVHHGGLLPILKEMVEILFSKNLIKILFATETFAMGVNMPARCVVFNTIRKHDGVQFRELQPGEYTQMAGRAGRRGLDKVGTVILCCFGDQPPPQLVLRNMLTGSSTKLSSQFRLTYTMILNLLRVEDMSVESMIKRSFSEFATQRALTTNEYPKLLTKGTKTLIKLDEEFKGTADSRVGAEDVEGYYFASKNALQSNKELLSYILSAGGTGGGALVAGRVLLLNSGRKKGYVRACALVLRPPATSSKASVACVDDASCVCMVLLPQGFTKGGQSDDIKLGSLNYVGEAHGRYFAIHSISIDEILLVTTAKQKIDAKLFYNEEALKTNTRSADMPSMNAFAGARSMGSRQVDDPFAGMMARGRKGGHAPKSSKSTSVSQERQQVDEAVDALITAEKSELNAGLGTCDLKDCAKSMHSGNSAMEFGSTVDRFDRDMALARQFKSHYHPDLEHHYMAVDRKETLRAKVKTLSHLLSNESLQLFPDFLQRKAMLQSLGYIDENDTVCLKGRCACEVNTCEGLIVAEMVFEGMLNELEPAEIVASLSALLFQEKVDEELSKELPERLVSSCERMQAIALDLGQRQKDFGLSVDPLEYTANSLKLGLVHVVYEWACGVPFASICELTGVQEGSIVRTITRLDELCREVRNCARVVGNPTLYRKMEASSEAIKRDIVFASSLYVS